MPAKSKAQQRFMGMVHAAQKGDKAASAKVAKVAKRMKRKMLRIMLLQNIKVNLKK